jgi:hypothetical protein
MSETANQPVEDEVTETTEPTDTEPSGEETEPTEEESKEVFIDLTTLETDELAQLSSDVCEVMSERRKERLEALETAFNEYLAISPKGLPITFLSKKTLKGGSYSNSNMEVVTKEITVDLDKNKLIIKADLPPRPPFPPKDNVVFKKGC